ncbi:MAG: dTMP kinase [Pigeon pea little leaf phytoplasma]|uniref:Thymidylate kinase n=1 Tax=Candidatus Phytoplasma fabacearum TaxID=2982628 RepID=A0ABU8ZTB7_9MOLU|nr:dTMP kinase ['Bituminaria bituminosa' little leaf phytoplasma]MDV3153935.1 dTMP kinase [Pigeon pea little leaf phytoplasma]MDO7983396.1 dTMP kinase ['Bituminaria bituminosa' little leaf phytoplasma]MDO8023869.1 dTMP kinase ['Bituminaria bituminosa' little leaf phytoplasma]MDO8030615.1 dTMP kinase ['Bituminaria bituminosa' little leaf phytoplasma]MDV3158466.1 dTMP kinase [Pigeon pea little leaf phytoplasma]
MFISFEGGDGVGKTTHVLSLFQTIKNRYPVIMTKEPGGCNLVKSIKKILIDTHNKINFLTESLLYAADRTEHLQQVIKPALLNNKIVICDRYLDSSFVYQGYVRKLGIKFIRKINPLAHQLLPDITFYLDLEPKIILKRLYARNKSKLEGFDAQQLFWHQQIRKGYLKLCHLYPKRIFKINANNLSFEEVNMIILNKLRESFGLNI